MVIIGKKAKELLLRVQTLEDANRALESANKTNADAVTAMSAKIKALELTLEEQAFILKNLSDGDTAPRLTPRQLFIEYQTGEETYKN